MAYTTVDNIRSMFRNIAIKPDTGNEQTNTVVTEEDVERWIEEVDAEIDGFLVDYYAVPIVGPESLKIIRRVSTYKVAHIIKTVLEAKDELSDKDQKTQTNLENKANEILKKIVPSWNEKCCEWRDPMIQLQDADRKMVGPKTGSVFSASRGTTVIKKNGNNW